jgi:hypothetical protein
MSDTTTAARPAHTPRPWSLKTVPTSDGSCHKIGPFPSASRVHSETHACVYAIGIRLGIDDSTPVARELLANARLMTAAPDLLAVLQEVDAFISGAPDAVEPFGRVRAAIAKATGDAS